MRTALIILPTVLISLILGLVIGEQFYIDDLLGFEKNIGTQEIRGGRGALINPLLECEAGEGIAKISGLDPLRNKLEEYTNSNISSGNLTHASIYFRDFNNGPWFGIEEHEEFSPASLLKLPIMLSYYRRLEENPNLLPVEVNYDRDIDSPAEFFSPASVLKKGQTYKIKDLLNLMITRSDNTATKLLLEVIGPDYVLKTTQDIGVEVSTSDETGDFNVTVKGYSGLYRILYNASFVSKKSSSEILNILTKTTFNDGIRAGVPRDIVVAHKYGERNLEGKNQLHDCGIVYYKKNPYILCIMTKGQNFNKLASFISSVSKIVYDEVRVKYQ